MLNSPQYPRMRLQQLADGLLAALAVALAYALRSEFPLIALPELENFTHYIWLLLLAGLLSPVMLAQ